MMSFQQTNANETKRETETGKSNKQESNGKLAVWNILSQTYGWMLHIERTRNSIGIHVL